MSQKGDNDLAVRVRDAVRSGLRQCGSRIERESYIDVIAGEAEVVDRITEHVIAALSSPEPEKEPK